MFDKYSTGFRGILLLNITVESSKIHDEYTDYVTQASWTFADTWAGQQLADIWFSC